MLYFYSHFKVDQKIAYLPKAEPKEDLDAGGATLPTFALPGGGGVWLYGTKRAPRPQRTITRRGRYLETSANAILLKARQLGALGGYYGRLYRVPEVPSFGTQWMPAVLDLKPEQRDPTQLYRYRGWWALDVDITATLFDPYWHGAMHGPGWSFDSGVYFDSGRRFNENTASLFSLGNGAPAAVTLRNGGDAPVTRAQLIITANTGSPVAALHVVGPSMDWTWDSTRPGQSAIAAGTSLVIDSAAASILNNGADAWGGLVTNSGHALDTWLELAPSVATYTQLPALAGATTLSVISTAGMAAGAVVQVLMDSGAVHRTTVSGAPPSATSLVIADALPANLDSAASVWVEGTTAWTVTATIGGSHTAANLSVTYDESWN